MASKVRDKYATCKLSCLQCLSSFFVRPYRKDEALFCSKKCSTAHRMSDPDYVEKLKEQCGSLMKKGMQPENSKNWKGENHPNWKGGRSESRGYILIRHPDTGEYVREHRFVMEEHLGRTLVPDEHVHHINHNTRDNRLENLMVMSAEEHGRLHGKEGGKCSKYGD